MYRQSQNLQQLCEEKKECLAQLRRKRRENILNEKRNKIILYDSLNELFNAYPDLENSNWYSPDYLDFIKDCWENSIACIFTLKSNHFLMTNVDEFEEITNIMSGLDNFKYVIIIACHKYIYIDNQFDLHNLIENSTNIFKWWDDKMLLLDQTFNEFIGNKRTLIKFYTNILEEAFNYIKQNYDDYNIPLLLDIND